MRLENKIDFSKYKRFFAFGCSFTDYKWPMWPEVISNYIPNYYNFGCAGCDNRTIFLRILEADALYNFNEEDLVIVMWTTIWRDTIFDPKIKWQLLRVRDEDLHFNQINFIFRDFCYFKSIYHLLEHKNIDYDFLSMSGYSYDMFEKFHLFFTEEKELKEISKLLTNFDEVLNVFKPSIFETVYKLNWHPDSFKFSLMMNENNKRVNDNHPTPMMSYEYMTLSYPQTNFENSLKKMSDYENKVVGEIITERIQPNNMFETLLLRYPLIGS